MLKILALILALAGIANGQDYDGPGPFDDAFPSPYEQLDAPYGAQQPQDAYSADRFRSRRDDFDSRGGYGRGDEYDGREYERPPAHAPRMREDDWEASRDPPRFAEDRHSSQPIPIPSPAQQPAMQPAAPMVQAQQPMMPVQMVSSVPGPIVTPQTMGAVQQPGPLIPHAAEPLAAASNFRMMEVSSGAVSGVQTAASAATNANANANAGNMVTAMTTAEVQGEEDDGEKDPLDAPLEEIKHDIIAKSKQIKEELEWIKQVEDVIKKYTMKIENVQANVGNLRQEVKTLLKKKRQIQNLKLQKQLQSKLEDANADMGTISTALNHVRSKENNFQRTKKNLGETIGGLKKALAALKGQTLEQMEAEERGEDPNAATTAAPLDPAADPAAAIPGSTAALALLLEQSAKALATHTDISSAESSAAAVAAAQKALAALNGIGRNERELVNDEAASDPHFELRDLASIDASIEANDGAFQEEQVDASVSRALLSLKKLRKTQA